MVVKCISCGAYDTGATCRVCEKSLPPEEKSGDSVDISEVSNYDPNASPGEIAAPTSIGKSTGPDKVAIIVVSALFGPFGAIPANSAAKQAAAMGLPTRPYWKAFWVTWLISGSVLIVAQIIFWNVVLGSINSSMNTYSLSSNAGTSTVLVDCSNSSLTIDVDGTVCQSNNSTASSWIPVGYNTGNSAFGYNPSIVFKWAAQGYSCQDGQAHCQEIYAISKSGCKNGITASLNLLNSAGTKIASATGTSNSESPMEIVQISIGSDLQEWTSSSLAGLACAP